LNTRQFLKHWYLHALAKLATVERIELRSLSALSLSYLQVLLLAINLPLKIISICISRASFDFF